MSVLDREALDESPLADLHTIASELSIDGYRRLRRADLIEAILDRQGGRSVAPEDAGEAASTPTLAAEPQADDDGAAPRRRRGRRGGRGRAGSREEEPEASAAEEPKDRRPSARGARAKLAGVEDGDTAAAEPAVDGRAAEKGVGDQRDRGRAAERRDAEKRDAEKRDAEKRDAEKRTAGPEDDQIVEGVVELLANGSGFLRMSPPEASDDDVYISAAQVKRCELVAGDRISGPRREPRRSERFPSLVRIDLINGRPAEEVAEGARFDDLPAAFPVEAFRLGSDDPALGAIESLAPFGKGSRVTVVGPARAGKTEILRSLAGVLTRHGDLEVSLVLAGVRPEEIFEWGNGTVEPSGAVSFAASADAQAHTIERVIEQARRIAARGANAVVLIDTLEGVHPPAARKALAAARNIVGGGSLTVIATAAKPFGGETTVIALDGSLAAAGRFPALDPRVSGTLRPEVMVGETRAKAIAKARAKATAESE
jgi:transcription termination factor Rho